MKTWALQDAKNKFSEVVDRSQNEGPQIITRHGKATSVVISIDAFNRHFQSQSSFIDFMRESPWVGTELDLSREKRKSRRKVDL